MEEDGKNPVLERIMKAMNDLKSDMGIVKKYLNLSDTSKPNDAQKPKKTRWRNNEQEDKSEKKNKFAGMAAKGTKKITGPSSLSNRIVRIDDSDDSDEEANFAGIAVPTIDEHKHDFRILTSNNNTTALGSKCVYSQMCSPQMEFGSRLGRYQSNSERLVDRISNDRLQVTIDTEQLSFLPASVVQAMDMIGGQNEMINVPDDIEPIMEEEVQTGPTPAIATVIQPSSPDPPSAPQVEHYVDIPGFTVQELSILQPQAGDYGLVPPSIRPRTRSIARFEGYVIPEPRDISDSEEDEEAIRQVTTPLPRPRISNSSATLKAKDDSKSRRKPLSNLNITPNVTTRRAKAMELELRAIENRLRKPTSTPTPNSSSEACPSGATSSSDDEIPSLVSSSSDEENNM